MLYSPWQPNYETVDLWWDGDTSAVSYELYRSDDATVDDTDTLVYADSHDATLDTTIAPDTMYYYAVRAVNAAGASGFSNVEAITTDPEPTQAPTNPHITASNETNGSVDLDFGADGAASYEVYRSTDATVDDTDTLVYNGSDASIVDTDLSPNTTYYYAVRGINVAGTGVFSDPPTSVTTTNATPGTPLVSMPDADDYRVRLEWADVAGGVEYNVYRATDSAGPWDDTNLLDVVGSASGGTLQYYDWDIDSANQYYYAVRGVNGSVEGTLSNVVRAGGISLIIE
jgi:fibronectin type 3 domain-containing protein